MALVFLVHLVSPTVTSTDSRWSIPAAVSLARHGDFDLDEYEPVIEREGRYAVHVQDGHTFSYFPYGTTLLVAPAVLMADLVFFGGGLEAEAQAGRVDQVEQGVASVLVAVTASLVYLVSLAVLRRRPLAFLAAGIFGFGTAAWSTASRGLWMHGPEMLLLTAALLLGVKAERRAPLAAWTALPLALAFVVRPTAMAAIVAFGLWVAVQHRRQLPGFLAIGAVVGLGFVALNLAMFGRWLHPYYDPSTIGPTETFFEALAGNLVSPSRGLLVFTPLFVLIAARRRRLAPLEWAAAGTIGLHLLLISRFFHWWGGHSYGPRLFSDVTPLLVFLLLPVLPKLGRPRPAMTAAFAVLLAVSVLVHGRGAIAFDTWLWNSEPVSVDEQPSRLWDWRDAQFLRGL